MEVGGLAEAIDQLVEAGPSALGDGESLQALHRQLARLEALVTGATAAFDAAQGWAPDGAKGAAAWIATRCGLPRGLARHRVGLGRRLRHLPACERAWLDGHINGAHVGAIAGVRREATLGSSYAFRPHHGTPSVVRWWRR